MIAPLFGTILSGVELHQAGSGSGALQSFQQIGSALGVALPGQIFFPLVAAGLAGHLARAAFDDAFRASLVYEIAICLALAALALTLPAPRQEPRHPAPAGL
ncbi:MAG: hypothetical protein RIB84_17455 [Sneathiellaceae bacterium]